jgi:4,5-DOPA dioxygenase extradiol
MMPTLFVGHGSPMNALEENEYTLGWRQAAEAFPRPSSILCISAHWYTHGTFVYTGSTPRTIHDFFGFPKELYQIAYPAPGAPFTAKKTLHMLPAPAAEDNSWGLDHGTWSVLRTMYPEADIPVFQISVDASAPPERHFSLGRSLRPLREENILIVGSGNIVHNLALIDFDRDEGFDWAYDFDAYIDYAIRTKSKEDLLHYGRAGKSARYAVNIPDHFYPLLYVLGAAYGEDTVLDFNHSCLAGSLSMTSYIFQP